MTSVLDDPTSRSPAFSLGRFPSVADVLIDAELPAAEDFEVSIQDADHELSRNVAVSHYDTEATPFAYKFAIDPRRVYRAERHSSYMVETNYDGWSYWDFLRD